MAKCCYRCRYTLPDHRGDGGAGDSQRRHSQQTKNQDRVKDQVGDCAAELGGHAENGIAGGGQQPLKEKLTEQAEGENHHNAQVLHPQRSDFRVGILNLPGIKGLHNGKPQHQEQRIAENVEQCAVGGGVVRPAEIFLPQGFGQQRVDAHAGARAYGDQQRLEREGQGHRRQRVFRKLRHKDTVHDVVQRLYQHGYHHWQGYAEHQAVDGKSPHLVFGQIFLILMHCLFLTR